MSAVLIVCGMAVLVAAWFGPLPGLAESAFFAHMAIHVSVVAVAAPLIAAAIVGIPRIAGRMPRLLYAPIPASLFEFIVVWGWHFPAAHLFARSSAGAFAAEQASFLAAGLLLWGAALRRSVDEDGGRGAGVVALLLTSMHMILLGTLLALAPRALYHHGSTATTASTQLADQQLGGMLMLLGGGLPYLLGALWLVWGLLQGPVNAAPGHAPVSRGELQ